ncbi:MAG TPA: metal-dependent hydrolase [Spirochaetota bacterium]|nr:metal-dependent hydrolase [Spirochaetota bacterium]
MPTFMTHAVTGIAASRAMFPARNSCALAALSALSAVLPDIDILAFGFGIPYGHWLGHRGFSHSLAFAACWALLASTPFTIGKSLPVKLGFGAYFFFITALHGVLDAMTSGGLGVAFFSPFDTARYFLPWRPIRVSPIGIESFLTQRGLMVMASELKYVWLPSAVVMLAGLAVRFATKRARSRGMMKFSLPLEK